MHCTAARRVCLWNERRRQFCQTHGRHQRLIHFGKHGLGLPSCSSASDPVLSAALEMDKSEGQKAATNKISQRAITFQEALAKLQSYWSSIGCASWLPHSTEVGAGTMNPATFLRVLGPEPWNVCYPEPSIRPDDSRYGQNPNRIQRHTQFQVILKPDPGNPQELYLKSLEAIGIDCDAHDIRFVEDNWESPVLGAWGLGWEVWLDGMEITQFTYFQQAGSIPLPVPAIEITYGLERILMSLQNVTHFKDIQYTDFLTYGELLLQTEVEMSRYNMDEAIVDDHWQRFQLYKDEMQLMLEKELPLPAYDCLLKCSHTFNILDARGAIGVTERNVCFGTMRKLTRQVATLWLEQRQKMGFPLMKASQQLSRITMSNSLGSVQSAEEPRLFVLEIGTEELPPDDVTAAIDQLRTKLVKFLNTRKLQHGDVYVQGTTRRLSIFVNELHGVQSISDTKVRGPPEQIAFDEDGSPSKALLGFCKKNGCSVDTVTIEADAKGARFVYGIQQKEARNTADVLVEDIPKLLQSITFRKSMQWNGDTTWSRPIRWILALHGDVTIPIQFAKLTASSTTRLLRQSHAPTVSVPSAESYTDLIKSSGIVLATSERKEIIWKQAQAAAGKVRGTIPERYASSALLDEVVQLVELPSAILGTFPSEFLSLPKEVLETVMEKYQRYFAIYGSTDATQNQMLPYFVAIGNGDFDPIRVQSGYEAVLCARFKDAQFFYEEDLQQSLESFRPKLAKTMFHKDLGSLLEKCERTEKLILPIAKLMEIDTAIESAQRAAVIYKADLATSLVTEMTSLAGTMGRYYALKSGEQPDVAEAIFESTLPRFAGDKVPVTSTGLLLSIADKIDSIVGLVAAKCAPTATADPYGLRRMAYGLVEALINNAQSLDIAKAVRSAAVVQPIDVESGIEQELCSFIERRLEQYLLDLGIIPEIVKSSLAERRHDPYLAAKGAQELAELLKNQSESQLPLVMTAMGRVTRILKNKDISGDVEVDLFQEKEEHDLWQAYLSAKAKAKPSMSIAEFLQICSEELVQKIDALFDGVYVMCDDQDIRANRMKLLKTVESLAHGVLDFSELPGI